jgi:hypothetical protein
MCWLRALTVWHSVAASAPEHAFKIPTISRAKRSTAMPCWAAHGGRLLFVVRSIFFSSECNTDLGCTNKFTHNNEKVQTPMSKHQNCPKDQHAAALIIFNDRNRGIIVCIANTDRCSKGKASIHGVSDRLIVCKMYGPAIGSLCVKPIGNSRSMALLWSPDRWSA